MFDIRNYLVLGSLIIFVRMDMPKRPSNAERLSLIAQVGDRIYPARGTEIKSPVTSC